MFDNNTTKDILPKRFIDLFLENNIDIKVTKISNNKYLSELEYYTNNFNPYNIYFYFNGTVGDLITQFNKNYENFNKDKYLDMYSNKTLKDSIYMPSNKTLIKDINDIHNMYKNISIKLNHYYEDYNYSLNKLKNNRIKNNKKKDLER